MNASRRLNETQAIMQIQAPTKKSIEHPKPFTWSNNNEGQKQSVDAFENAHQFQHT
jgi:hypothetical protein